MAWLPGKRRRHIVVAEAALLKEEAGRRRAALPSNNINLRGREAAGWRDREEALALSDMPCAFRGVTVSMGKGGGG